ncbi:MAG: dihydroorotate dehydrogenase [Actinomycetota bacterium]
MKRTLAVDLGGMSLTTPVMIASGCAGAGRELSGLVDLHKVGALVTRTITVLPRKGSATPRIAETPAGIVWDTGLQNPGLDVFVDEELPRLAKPGVPVVVSIGGGTLEDYVRLTSAMHRGSQVAAIEIHLAGRDDELAREVLGAHVDRVTEVVGAVARMSRLPVYAKLPATVGIADLARAAVRAGATGVTVGGSPQALGVDADRLRPDLGAVTGWLSGPAVKPLTLRAVFEAAHAVPGFPVIASGGIRTGDDAVECLLAGAWAVQVGTAALVDPAAPVVIAKGIARYLKSKNLGSPEDIRGRLRVPASFAPLEESV